MAPAAAACEGASAASVAAASVSVSSAEPLDLSPQWFDVPPPPPSTGWERLRALVRRDELNQYPEETMNILKMTTSAGVIGLFYGGMPAFISAKKRYIERSDAEVFYNRLHAVQSAHRAGIRGFIRYGWRWGWRIAAFVGIFNVVNVGLTVYRDKTTFSHFAIAGACTGGLFRMHLGWRGLAGGILFGALLGLPAGQVPTIMHKLSGETVDERRKRLQRELYEQKLAAWKEKLNITENIKTETDDVSWGRTEEMDSRKMQ